MRIALINSGLGLLAPAAALHRMRPDADLVLAPDPDGMPWGPRTPDDIADRALLCARAAMRYQPDVLVMACNTGSVHALEAMRAEFEPGIPVIGTVPAIKPAAAAYQKVAIWATVATTASAYQRRLVAEFAGSADVTPVACPGLADAVDAGDPAATAAAVATAAARTPGGCEAVVLGCTEYELVAGQIREVVPGAVTLGSADAVAAQALRRIPATGRIDGRPIAGQAIDGRAIAGNGSGELRPEMTSDAAIELPAVLDAELTGGRHGAVRVLLSGRPSGLPQQALRYPEGRLLAPLVVVGDEREPTAGQVAGH
ncbi:MAG TPA: aspartate/glutamate racemase family protein [Streptosporangiaceae bacterium]|nr:aspartate/glutamate racemase family protein [Streptosporangiaceae bacterium]